MRVQSDANTMGVVTWLHGDHLGSASVATDAGGNKIAGSDTRYLPYGEVRPGYTGSGLPTDRRYTDQISVAGGLMDYGARFYDPVVGRFVSADTIVPNPADPQSLNRYSYVRNSPLNSVDPSGHADCNIHQQDECLPDDGAVNGISQRTVVNFYVRQTRRHGLYNVVVQPNHWQRLEGAAYSDRANHGSSLNQFIGPPKPLSKWEVGQYLNQQELASRPKAYNRTADYVAFTASVNQYAGVPWSIGISVAFDTYGGKYVSLVGGIGLSPYPISGNISYGFIGGLNSRNATQTEVRSFLVGTASNAGGGYLIGAGYTKSGSASVLDAGPEAFEWGLYSPQIGYAASQALLMVDESNHISPLPGLFP